MSQYGSQPSQQFTHHSYPFNDRLSIAPPSQYTSSVYARSEYEPTPAPFRTPFPPPLANGWQPSLSQDLPSNEAQYDRSESNRTVTPTRSTGSVARRQGSAATPDEDTSSSARFTLADQRIIVEGLAAATARGESSDNGFKTTVWNSITKELNDHLTGGGLQDVRATKNHFTYMKSNYWLPLKTLRKRSGFGWDASLGCVTAAPHWWSELEALGTPASRKLLRWRGKSWELYDAFNALVDDKTARGDDIETPDHPRERSPEIDLDDGEEQSQPPTTPTPSSSQSTRSKRPSKTHREQSNKEHWERSNNAMTQIVGALPSMQYERAFQKIQQVARTHDLPRSDVSTLFRYFSSRTDEAAAFLAIPEDYVLGFLEDVLAEEKERIADEKEEKERKRRRLMSTPTQ